MSHRAAGVAFCSIAAMLLATHYLAAAIYGSNVSSWSAELFSHMLSSIGWLLPVCSAASLVAGIAYLVRAELPSIIVLRRTPR